jgi:hypothetical protein
LLKVLHGLLPKLEDEEITKFYEKTLSNMRSWRSRLTELRLTPDQVSEVRKKMKAFKEVMSYLIEPQLEKVRGEGLPFPDIQQHGPSSEEAATRMNELINLSLREPLSQSEKIRQFLDNRDREVETIS